MVRHRGLRVILIVNSDLRFPMFQAAHNSLPLAQMASKQTLATR